VLTVSAGRAVLFREGGEAGSETERYEGCRVTVAIVLIGAGLVFIGLRDIFQQLFRPSGGGSLSRFIMRVVWRSFRRLAVRRPGALALAGPGVLLSIIATWVVLLVTGWALIFWPYLPDEFVFASGLERPEQGGFIDALYLSLVTLTTLGYGDITPESGPLRVLAPLEALVGFALLTASISWVLSVYPVLSRHRALAHEITLIRDAESETGIDVSQTGEVAEILDSLTSQLVAVRGDLLRFPITYYFYSDDERSALPAHVGTLFRLAKRGSSPDRPPAIRLRAAMLLRAIEDFSDTVSSRFLLRSTSSIEAGLDGYARDHLRSFLDDEE
jgi:hypothetical protein